LSGNENLYRKEMELIKKSKTPIIGICFGFELILKTYKEKIYFSRDKVSGLSKIIFNSKVFKVWQNHFWVAKKLKLNSKLIPLSDSKNGIEIVKVKRRNIYGLQFHPEHVDHPNDGLVIFKYILTTIFS
jgi:anthranilate/para-aminobenzoate synthase component II